MKKIIMILLISIMCFGCAANHVSVKPDTAIEQPAKTDWLPVLLFILI